MKEIRKSLSIFLVVGSVYTSSAACTVKSAAVKLVADKVFKIACFIECKGSLQIQVGNLVENNSRQISDIKSTFKHFQDISQEEAWIELEKLVKDFLKNKPKFERVKSKNQSLITDLNTFSV